MPALPNKQPVAVRQNRVSTSPTRNSMNNNSDRGGYRQGAPANLTSSRNPNSMYTAMSMALGKELEQKVVTEDIKVKKAAQSTPRPSTPHGKGKNFIERNKQSVQAFPVSPIKPTHKKSKEESQSVSPTPTLKKSAANPIPNRPVTPGANGQSSARPQAAKTEKKTKTTSSNKSRPVSPPASSAHSAHSRSHESAHHSAHSRSHVRAASPEISLREEVKKLRRLLLERDDWLREKEEQLLDAEDIIEAYQERVRQVEARNRELQKENEFMRNYIEEDLEKKKSSEKEPTTIISSVMNNIQRIRGEPVSPISKPDSPILGSKPSSPIPIVSPKASPVLTTTKSQELLKANKNARPVSPPIQPRVVPKATRGNLILANKVNDVQSPKGNDHPPRPTAPSPAAMNRHEPSLFNNGGLKRTEMSDRHAEISRDRQASDRKQAAALNVVMEESEDSEVDEFIFERDETSDDQADSEFDATGTESENEDDYISSGNTNVNDTENESDDDFDKWSTHASSKHTLNSIIEDEEEEEEDDEFEYEPQQHNRQQQKNNWTPVNPIEPSNATVAQVASVGTASSQNVMANFSEIQNNDNSNNGKPSYGRLRRRHLNSFGSDSSDSGVGSAHEENFDDNLLNSNGQIINGQSVYSSSKQQKLSTQKQISDFSLGYPHRDSMSSIKSDSSDDSILSVTSSHNDSYSSPITSPSSADISPYGSFTQSIKSVNSQQNSASSNGIYGQSSSNSSNLSSSKMMSSNTCNPMSQLNNNGSNSSYNNAINSKRSSSPNSVKSSKNVSNQSNSRSTSPSTVSTRPLSPASSSRASTPSSNASTARAPSPASSSSSRASTPASESSRNASSGYNRRSRLNGNSNGNSSSDKCQTAIPPPPPPPANKDPFATLQHYLRLISENSVMENPLKSYDINKVIDEGSSAKVYNANPLSNPNEECAIKVVPLSYSLEFIFNEIYVLKNLKHKNIVDFKESFLRWDGKTREVWIAMEKCARGDVTSRAGKVNQREVGRIAGELLSALKHLHANGIIHRDIKLSNILADANNEIKLADFGISSLTPTSTTAMVGTIPYMAPDVVLVGPDRPYDTKVDIWSVGVCILELLTGKAAWGRIRDDEIMDKLRRGEMPYGFQRLRKKADIGWEAVDFLEKCFARTPDNRWSAEKLLEHPFITGNRN